MTNVKPCSTLHTELFDIVPRRIKVGIVDDKPHLNPLYSPSVRVAVCRYVPGARVLDLIDDRETHIEAVICSHTSMGRQIPKFAIWFDASIHKLTGNGTVRAASDLILL